MSEIISRRNAVRRIALRYGYPEYRAEDIAQEAALQLLANPKRGSQNAKQAFVDALRSGGEGNYTRAGIPTQPIYESSFEDYANFIDAHGGSDDPDGRANARGELLDAIDCIEVLRTNWRIALEMYAEGFGMDKISERLGCSVSRVSQLIKFSRLEIKKAIVQKSVSRQEQRKRKFCESKPIPREVQERPRASNVIPFPVEAVRFKAIEGVVSFKVPKVPQGLFKSF